jgi:FMN phosphatase YigB (HAD superfamily)
VSGGPGATGGAVDNRGTSPPRSATLPSGAPTTGGRGDLCAVGPGSGAGASGEAGAPVDLDDWAVRRRRALWRAAGARAAGAKAAGARAAGARAAGAGAGDGRRVGERGPGRAPAAVLLDMGGVVIPTLFESVAVAGFPGGPFRGEVEYAAVERGDLAERDYWARLAERRPDLDVGALWRACSRVRAEVRAAMDAVAGRVRLVAFTNDMAHWFGPDWPGRFPELAGFDQVVEAARLGVLKPDPEAFRLAADAIGEAPERCLFVDDLAVNLDGAAATGMQTLLFEVRDPAGSTAALLARLGLDPDPGKPGPGRVFSLR